MGVTDVLKRKRARTRTVEIVLNDGLVERRDELIASISRMKRLESWADSGDMASPLPNLQDELRDVLEQIEGETAVFEFVAMSRNEWNAAVDEHTLDDGSLDDSFDVFIVAKSSTGENQMTEDEVREIYNSAQFSPAECDLLFQAAYAVNREARDIPFTEAGIDAILSTGSKSTTAENED